MSTSAIKSSMPGVGASPPASGHSLLPMNVVAQKVMPGNESGAMKPLSGTGLSYVTLQPASQPLSLVQDHRPQQNLYQTPAAYNTSNNTGEKDLETPIDKSAISNGVEVPKVESTEQQQLIIPPKQNQETNRNNNLSPETSPIESNRDEIKSEQPLPPPPPPPPPSQQQQQQQIQPAAIVENLAVSAVPIKIDDKKALINNGSKEVETSSVTSTTSPIISTGVAAQNKISPQKMDDSSSGKLEVVQKSKQITPTKSTSESPLTSVKSEQKVATIVRMPKRKSRELKDLKGMMAEGVSKPKRNRVQTQPYQSPLPEIALIVKTLNKTPSSKNPDDKLIVFYKAEFLAVRNAEGSFYVCQAMQNIYKSSRRIRIRWLSQDKNNGEIYSPDFYDYTDFDCILTNLNLNKVDKNKYQLTKFELLRTENILKRAIDVEAGVSEKPSVTEEHPDGLDLSLYKDEAQLKKRKSAGKSGKQRQRKRSRRESSSSSEDDSSSDEDSDKKSSPRSNRMKKRTTNKALAIAKSVAKVPSRAKRALNREMKMGSISSESTTTNSANSGKRNADSKKQEAKKPVKQSTTANSSATTLRTKLRGSGETSEESSTANTTGRAKRVVASTGGIAATKESSSSRSKSRSRA
ncbi:hypothetical protein PV326_001769 [Microctonus aethiopoides]|nr:hypothetical protein PV326_001769 [Microctonus aethiopoides]